jgi:Zn-dependent protease
MTFILVLVLWVASLCLHEYAHARIAFAGGDTSVEEKGYLTLNPIRYADPMLSVVFPLVFLALGGIGLPGGAVYIERWRLRNRRWEATVSAAGPSTNLALAVVVSVVLHLAPVQDQGPWPALAFFGWLQVSAVVLNLIPLPPLDGWGIIEPFVGESVRESAAELGRWSLWGLFLVLWYVPPVNAAFWGTVSVFSSSVGIPADLALKGYRAFRFL